MRPRDFQFGCHDAQNCTARPVVGIDDVIDNRHGHIGRPVPTRLLINLSIRPAFLAEQQHNGLRISMYFVALLALQLFLPGHGFLGQDRVSQGGYVDFPEISLGDFYIHLLCLLSG